MHASRELTMISELVTLLSSQTRCTEFPGQNYSTLYAKFSFLFFNYFISAEIGTNWDRSLGLQGVNSQNQTVQLTRSKRCMYTGNNNVLIDPHRIWPVYIGRDFVIIKSIKLKTCWQVENLRRVTTYLTTAFSYLMRRANLQLCSPIDEKGDNQQQEWGQTEQNEHRCYRSHLPTMFKSSMNPISNLWLYKGVDSYLVGPPPMLSYNIILYLPTQGKGMGKGNGKGQLLIYASHHGGQNI